MMLQWYWNTFCIVFSISNHDCRLMSIICGNLSKSFQSIIQSACKTAFSLLLAINQDFRRTPLLNHCYQTEIEQEKAIQIAWPTSKKSSAPGTHYEANSAIGHRPSCWPYGFSSFSRISQFRRSVSLCILSRDFLACANFLSSTRFMRLCVIIPSALLLVFPLFFFSLSFWCKLMSYSGDIGRYRTKVKGTAKVVQVLWRCRCSWFIFHLLVFIIYLFLVHYLS